MTDASQHPPIDPLRPIDPVRRHPVRSGRAAIVGIAVCLSSTALGAPLGMLWAALAPSVPVRMTDNGASLIDAQPEEFVAADGWFTLLGLGFGVLTAIAVWLLLRNWRGPLTLVAVTVGAVGAGLVAWRIGREIGVDEYQRLLESAPVGTDFGKPADLRATTADWFFGFLPMVRGNVLVPALGAAVAYTLLAGWSRYASLRPEPDDDEIFPEYAAAEPAPAGPPAAGPVVDGPFADGRSADGPVVSWGSTATPTPQAAPAPPAPGQATQPPG